MWVARRAWLVACLGICGAFRCAPERRAIRWAAVTPAFPIMTLEAGSTEEVLAELSCTAAASEAVSGVLAASGLRQTVGTFGTTIVGPADDVWAAARAAFEACGGEEPFTLKVRQGQPRAAASPAAVEAATTAAVAPAREARVIHTGSTTLPPLVEVPGGVLPLAAIVKPPDADTLWQWQESRGDVDADSSWASVWPAAATLAAYIAASAGLVRGKVCAELGAGLGVTGLVAAQVEAACTCRMPHATCHMHRTEAMRTCTRHMHMPHAQVGAASVTLIDREPLALHCALSTAAVCGLPTGPVPSVQRGEEGVVGAGGGDGESRPPMGTVSASMADWGTLAAELTVDVVLAAEVRALVPSCPRALSPRADAS